MNLVIPDSGLLFWMVLIFGVVFFLLWKFGFPIITDMVEQRTKRIDDSLALAREAEARMQDLSREQAALLDKTRQEQGKILQEAAKTREQILAQAREEASAQAAEILRKARVEIAAEKESALRDIRKEVALLSVGVAEKVLRKDLSDSEAQSQYLDALVEEMFSGKDSQKAN